MRPQGQFQTRFIALWVWLFAEVLDSWVLILLHYVPRFGLVPAAQTSGTEAVVVSGACLMLPCDLLSGGMKVRTVWLCVYSLRYQQPGGVSVGFHALYLSEPGISSKYDNLSAAKDSPRAWAPWRWSACLIISTPGTMFCSRLTRQPCLAWSSTTARPLRAFISAHPASRFCPTGITLPRTTSLGPRAPNTPGPCLTFFNLMTAARTGRKIATIEGAFWSTLFTHRGALYLIGPDRHHGNVLIRRSADGGATWTSPTNSTTGLLRGDGEYHCAPVPVIEHAGRLWRAMEHRDPPIAWGINYRAGMLSVPVDADLLDATNWTCSNFLPSDRAWNSGDMGAWLEGNAVVTPAGELVDALRVQTRSPDEKAAIVHISPDGKSAFFDPATGFLKFPGGAKKFTIRYDPRTKRYWSLACIVLDRDRADDPGRIRNTLALTSSSDLLNWEVRCILLYHPDVARHGFQYVDWLFDGEDIIATCRTAFDNGQGGAHNAHDANFLTFHRFANFRRLTMADSVPSR